MEPKFQTSFIPKKPIVTGVSSTITRVYGSTNIFSVIAMAFFLVTVITSGGLFFYKKVLTSQIAQADTEITAARKALEVDKIQELINANAKIKSSRDLLDKHVAVSNLITFILINLHISTQRAKSLCLCLGKPNHTMH